MTQGSTQFELEPRSVAVATTIVLGLCAGAVLLFYLIDVLLLIFVGVVVAAALQPWHQELCRRGIPKVPAVLMLYFVLLASLALIGLLTLPVLAEQVGALITAAPEQYESIRTVLVNSQARRLLRLVGERLPSLQVLGRGVANLAPTFYRDVIDFTASAASVVGYFVAVLAIALYWTLELPRVERLLMSFVPAVRRATVLAIWHEIETKLGAFVRGQAIAMLVIAVASAIGYALIGLPNVMALALMAGLLEAVPIIGPILAAVPAIAIALPLGLGKVALVVGWLMMLQLVENNVLIPRIMSRTVGISGLVGLVSLLAFGTLYGIMGVFIAIPLTAAIQVVLDRLTLDVESAAAAPGQQRPIVAMRTRLEALRLEARRRLRDRDTRLGLAPTGPGNVADAIDNKIEEAAKRVEDVIRIAEAAPEIGTSDQGDRMMVGLTRAIAQMEDAVARVSERLETPSPPRPSGQSSAEIRRTTGPLEQAATQMEELVAVVGEENVGEAEPPARRAKPRRRGADRASGT